MDISLYISFLILSVGIIIIPGPNVLIIVSTSLQHGKTRGLQTVAGTSIAMLIQLILAAISTKLFIQFLSDGFIILKYCGVAYLLYLGISHLKAAFYSKALTEQLSTSASFTRGFLVSLTNPKTILFFGAFLPQFISPNGDYLFQMSILSISFLVMAIALDSCYALLSVRLKPLLEQRNLYQLQNSVTGILLLGASTWLATTRRIQ